MRHSDVYLQAKLEKLESLIPETGAKISATVRERMQSIAREAVRTLNERNRASETYRLAREQKNKATAAA